MTAIKTYLNACAGLLEQAIEQARADDPEGVQGLANVLRCGGLVTLRSTFAPSTGLAQVCVEVIEPSGQAHSLMTAELTNSTLQ
jgi:hypothetical protein